MAIGLNFPFAPTTGSIGYFGATDSQLDAIRQNIRSLLSTNWGERLMQPDLGCNLIEFCFEQRADSSLRQRIFDRVRSQMARWMPFVSVVNVDVMTTTEDPSLGENDMSVSVTFVYGNLTDVVVMSIVP